ncbi:biopolymer transporter ExbD [Phaeovulum vinaykumarii]|uniref:biopolymer transporter ExbD n=1 Tax=Phaeovulum vinaykumarii TaxID=407234 RepID=UPI001AECA7C9|nr:biopolymer transporter ExbD [Phaeovulum vinaykumarii]
MPMINVVFLLLIFFLLAAQIRPAPPFTTELPELSDPARLAEEARGRFTLYLGADGRLGFRDRAGEAARVLADLAAARRAHCAVHDCTAEAPQLILRADRAVPAARLAGLLPRIAGAGFGRIALVAQGRAAVDRTSGGQGGGQGGG